MGGEDIARFNTEGAGQAGWDHRRSQLRLSRKACELCLAMAAGIAAGSAFMWAMW